MDERERLANEILRALSLALDTEESIKLHHAWRVAVIARRLGSFLGIADVGTLFHGGLLHDIGGIGMRDHVVHAARAGFTSAESRLHPARGARIVEPITVLRPLTPIILNHHEHHDGSGFPAGKREDEIPIEAQVVLLADLLDVNLRDLDPADRARAAGIVADTQRGKRIHPDVGTAALDLMASEPSFIPNAFEPAWLEAEVHRHNPPLRQLEDTSREELLIQLLWVFARVVDTKHTYTAGHSTRVAYYAYKIGQAFGTTDFDPLDVLWAGLLHDVGQIATPRRILDKEGKFTDQEWAVVREHPVHTERIIASISELNHIAYPAACHHERYDGKGYPGRRAGDAIPLLGRIIAYADVYDAVTSERPYRKGGTHEDGIRVIRREAGTHLDPHLLDIAVEAFGRHGVHARSASDGRGFERLLSDEVVHIGDIFDEEAPTAHLVRMRDHRVLLLQAEQWRTAYLNDALHVVRNRELLETFLHTTMARSVLEAFEADDAAELERQAARLLPRESFTQFFETKSGDPVEVVLVRGAAEGYTFLCRSAKGKFQSVQRLAMFNRNFSASSEASLFIDASGRVVDANQAFLDQYHTTNAAILNKTVVELPCAWAKLLTGIVARYIGAQSPTVDPIEIVDNLTDGTEVVALLSVAPVHDATGTFVGAVARFVDITARRRAERELAQRHAELADRNEQLRLRNEELERLNRLKSDLMAITSHDLNSPLAAVVGLARMVRDEADSLSPERIARAMDRLIDGGLRLRKLVHDILDLERIEAGTFKLNKRPIHLDAIIADVVDGKDAGEKDVSVEVTVTPRAAPVLADAARLEQVFTNLLSNAMRFSPRGGTIEIEHAVTGAGAVVVTISDRGPGIPEADLEQIFDRYFQVEKKHAIPKRGFGAGLGLSIVREIVALHGGSVRAENRPEGGCSFVVKLPAGAAAPAGTFRVMIVDPKGIHASTIQHALRNKLVDASVVDDVDLARRVLRHERPALIFVCGSQQSGAAVARLRDAAQGAGYAPLIVAVCDEDCPQTAVDVVLDVPILDVEIFEVVETARLRDGGSVQP